MRWFLVLVIVCFVGCSVGNQEIESAADIYNTYTK